nr:hypothetical protein [Rhodococcus sp. 14-2470-1b]
MSEVTVRAQAWHIVRILMTNYDGSHLVAALLNPAGDVISGGTNRAELCCLFVRNFHVE